MYSLDRKIQLYSVSTGQDAFGGSTKSNTLVATVRASVFYKNGSTTTTEGRPTNFNQIDFVIRYRSVLASYILLYENHKYRINAIEEIGRRRYLRLVCENNDLNTQV